MSVISLSEHENRRQEGRPTISALRGAIAAGLSQWHEWCRSCGRPAVVVEGSGGAQWYPRYVEVFLHHCGTQQIAEAAVAKRADRHPTALSSPTFPLHQLKLLFEDAGLGDEGADRLCRGLLESRAKGDVISPEVVAQWFSDVPRDDRWLAVLKAIVDFLPAGRSPALLVVPVAQPSSDPDRLAVDVAAVERAAVGLSQLTSEVPAAAVGLSVSKLHFDSYLKLAPESFSKAVLRESLVTIPSLSADEIFRQFKPRLGRAPDQYMAQIEQLAIHGATEDLVEHFFDAVLEYEAEESLEETPRESEPEKAADHERAERQAQGGKESELPEAQDAARSQTERFLFDLLEGVPDLAGLFELNVCPGFEFGNRPAEIDLACVSKKIAVEIDGYYHFTDRDAYRRDRRKDVLLQERGFFVLRFLAEDVVKNMEFICQSIRTVVQLREG